MSVSGTLSELAAEIADNLQQSAVALEPEKLRIQTRLREIEAVGAAARLAHDRLANFQIKIGADYQCPGCWIEHERRSSLSAVGGGTATEEFFTCHVCHFGIAIPIAR